MFFMMCQNRHSTNQIITSINKVMLVLTLWLLISNIVSSKSISISSPIQHDSSGWESAYWENLARQRIIEHHKRLSKKQPFDDEPIAKNVVMFLGDGMGLSTITASRILKYQLPLIERLLKQHQQQQQDPKTRKQAKPTDHQPQTMIDQLKKSEESYLSFESFENLALVKTFILDSQVGDSGACATALMSGVKANFETIGVDGRARFNDCLSTIDLDVRVSSLVDWAQQQGKATGFVTTTRITHATPAAMYAHSANRYWESDEKMSPHRNFENRQDDPILCKDIAKQLIEDDPGRNINVVMGGGSRNLLPVTLGGRRQDGRNLIDDWTRDKRQRGLTSSFVGNQQELLELNVTNVDYLLGLVEYSNHMAHEADRDQFGEPSLSEMVQKAVEVLKHNPNGFLLMIESGRIDHAHHQNNAYRALTDTLALDRAVEQVLSQINLSNTLVLVTADHSHVFTFGGFPIRGNLILGLDTQASDQNTQPYTTLLYGNGPGYRPVTNLTKDSENWINTAHKDYIQQAAIPKRWATHGGEDVPLYATGPGSQILNGVIDQTFVPFAISYATCMGPMRNLCLKHRQDPFDNEFDHVSPPMRRKLEKNSLSNSGSKKSGYLISLAENISWNVFFSLISWFFHTAIL